MTRSELAEKVMKRVPSLTDAELDTIEQLRKLNREELLNEFRKALEDRNEDQIIYCIIAKTVKMKITESN